MEIKYEIQGITLNEREIIDIHEYYEAIRVAKFIMDTHDIDEKEALLFGYEICKLINDGCDVDEAHEIVFERLERINNGKNL